VTKSLADTIISNPKARLGNDVLDCNHLLPDIRRAQRYVLSPDMAVTATTLSSAINPEWARKLIDLGWPPAEVTWIEWPSREMLETRKLMKTIGPSLMGDPPETRPEHCMTGILIRKDHPQAGSLHINCIEHDETGKGIWPWPLGYIVHRERYIGAVATPEVRAIWGYTEAVNIDPLVGHANATVHPNFSSSKGDVQKATNIMLQELAGLLRQAFSITTLLNLPTMTVIGQPKRPLGRYVGQGGKTHAYLSRTMVDMALPRTRQGSPTSLLKLIDDHHRRYRLHEVSAHYRHLRHEPKAQGWEKIEIAGATYWRKAIAPFLRGDPDLGVVEHEAHRVHGRPPPGTA
jgi:hypothetical protein